MPATFFLVRSVVARRLREKFDHWYSTDHLPWAIQAFKCEKAWRLLERGRAGRALRGLSLCRQGACDAALGCDEFKALVADFSRAWPEGVTRTRDVVTLAEERGATVQAAS